jgi:hypothetical protein
MYLEIVGAAQSAVEVVVQEERGEESAVGLDIDPKIVRYR